MSLYFFTSMIFIISYFAGTLGALTGLGGGVVLIPVLVLGLKIDIYHAIGTSLIAVIATSSGSAIAYLREGYTNLKIGMFLETSAIVGSVLGTYLLLLFNKNIIGIIFGVVLLVSAYLTYRRREEIDIHQVSHPWARYLALEDQYLGKTYTVQHVPLAWFIMLIAGALSSLLGIGSGSLKVLAMDQVMRLPYKVSTATSNFMMGMTAAASTGIYFSRGYIDPVLTFPIVTGVLLGAMTGAHLLHRARVKILRLIFTIAIVFLAVQMIYEGFIGHI